MPRKPKTESELHERYKWRKVEAPKAWQPEAGDELVGYYAGRTKRNGYTGEYEVVLVAVPGLGLRMLSGIRIIQLVDSAVAQGLDFGGPIRVRFDGWIDTTAGHRMKVFEMFVVEGELLADEDAPKPLWR